MNIPLRSPVAIEPPYFAVIFSSQRTGSGRDEYDQAARRMVELAAEQPGFLGIESLRGADGFGITVSYWESEAAIAAWKANVEHRQAQHKGRSEWYERYEVRVARIERAYASGSAAE